MRSTDAATSTATVCGPVGFDVNGDLVQATPGRDRRRPGRRSPNVGRLEVVALAGAQRVHVQTGGHGVVGGGIGPSLEVHVGGVEVAEVHGDRAEGHHQQHSYGHQQRG